MNVLASECSSGCDSGWTLYLEHSFLSPNAEVSHRNTKCGGFCEEKVIGKKNEEEEEEEEDLSMVSDASSGPPHFHEDQYEGYFNDVNGYPSPASIATTTVADVKGGKRHKKKERRCSEKGKKVLPSFLDDTASSPVFNFSSSKNDFVLANNNQASMKSVLDYSQAFSATHFQGRSAFQDHYGFLQPSSLSGNHLQNNQWY